MTDPFKYLGVSQNASKSEINDAYQRMKARYKCDKNADSLTRDIAENKLLEIDEAYRLALEQAIQPTNRIVNPNLHSLSKNQNNANSTNKIPNQNKQFQNGEHNDTNKYIHFENDYNRINSFINNKDFTTAEKVLIEYNLNEYAKWNYLFARLRFSQGWMNEAIEYYRKAYELEPNNQIYSQSYINICNMRDGKNKKHNNRSAILIAVGAGTFYCCCNASPILFETEFAHFCFEHCSECFETAGCTSICCDPCEDGFNAYCTSFCGECCT